MAALPRSCVSRQGVRETETQGEKRRLIQPQHSMTSTRRTPTARPGSFTGRCSPRLWYIVYSLQISGFSRSTFHSRIALKSTALRLRAKERPNVNAWTWREGRAYGWHSLGSLVCNFSQLHCHLRDYNPRGKSADFSMRVSLLEKLREQEAPTPNLHCPPPNTDSVSPLSVSEETEFKS